VCRANGTIQLWDHGSGREIGKLTGQTGRATAAAFSPDGAMLATGSSDGTVRLWDIAGGRPRFVLAGHTAPVHCVAFSRDGKTLASASEDGTVKLWHTVIGQEVGTLKVHRGPVTCVAFSPDGNTLATTGADATIRLCRAAVLEEVRQLNRPPGPEAATVPGEEQAREGHWQDAERELAEAVSRYPANSAWPIYLACVRLQARDFQGYRRLCQQRASSLAEKALNARDANNTAWLCCLAPDAGVDYAWAVAQAERAVAQANDKWGRELFLNTLGGILYRAGNYQGALDRLSQRLAENGSKGFPQDWAFLAMAHHRLGHQAESRRWLDKLRAYKPPDVPRDSAGFWSDLEIALLSSEAEALIGANKP
jgi:hypothetical protein